MTTKNNQRIRQFINHLPLCDAMGIIVEEGNETILSLPYSKSLIGDPNTGVIHGGAVSVLLDTACGAMVSTHPENTIVTATIDLRIDYMRPARVEKPLYASAEVIQTTRTVAFVRAKAWDIDPNDPVAMAAAAFTFAKKKRRV